MTVAARKYAAEPADGELRQRVILKGLIVNIFLAAGQLVIGVLSHSAALEADGFHTLSDLLSDGLVLLAAHFGAKGADEDHPYGHARIETAGTFGLSLVLIGTGIGIALHAADELSSPHRSAAPGLAALVMALLAVGVKEGLFRYMHAAADRLRSPILHANAWHYRTDAFSSAVVVVGVAGSLLGARDMDAIAAIGVAILIIRMGASLAWQALRELVDTGLEGEKLAHIRRVIMSIDGVRTLHLLRSRRVGGRAFVDVHILVDKNVSVSEGHQISEMVRLGLMRRIENMADVLVHIDPEDDEQAATNARLPLRSEVMARLEGYFAQIDEARAIESVTLHYLNGKLHIDIRLPLDLASDPIAARALQRRFQTAVAQDPQIADVQVCFS